MPRHTHCFGNRRSCSLVSRPHFSLKKYTWGSRQFTSGRRSTGTVGMMYPTAVRWFLAEFLYVGIFYTNVAPAQTDCGSDIHEGEEHTIECNITNCTIPVSRNNVVWCLNYCGINVRCDLSHSLCINSTGITNTVGETPTSIRNNIEVTNSGGLHNARVTFELRNTTYNCSVVDSEGNVCGPQSFAFMFRPSTLAQLTARIESTFPSSSVPGEVQVPNTHVGATRTLCVQGKSAQTDTYWTKAGLEIPAVSVSHTGCFTCGCLVDTNLNLSLGASPNEPQYSAFQAFGADCSGVVDFVSLLVIKNATFGDGGNYEFSISPREFPTTKTFVVQEPEYLSLEPLFHNPGAESTIVLNESSNARFLCNATTSGNANLEWRWRRNGATLPIPISNCSSSSIISGASLSDTCERCSPASMFTIPVGRTYIYSTDNEATVVLQQLELILCNVQANISGAYFCIASDSTRESARLEIESSPTESSPTPGNSNTTNAVVVPLIVVLMAVLTMLLLECDTVTDLLSQLSGSG